MISSKRPLATEQKSYLCSWRGLRTGALKTCSEIRKKILALWISVLRNMRDWCQRSTSSYEKMTAAAFRKENIQHSDRVRNVWLVTPRNPAVLPLLAISNLSHNYPVRLHLCSCLYHNTAEAPSKKGKICRDFFDHPSQIALEKPSIQAALHQDLRKEKVPYCTHFFPECQEDNYWE